MSCCRQRCVLLALCALLSTAAGADVLSWPLQCPDGSERNCLERIGKPDISGKDLAHDCSRPGYQGHTGTDFRPRAYDVQSGTRVVAAAPGIVAFAYDKFFDGCPSDHPQCRPGHRRLFKPGYTGGYTTCSQLGRTCNNDSTERCFWCFSGNHVVIRHDIEGVFATAYLHLGQDSVVVNPGQRVERGDLLGYVGSSGRSTVPHLHFEVWETGFYQQPVDPWAGKCGRREALWREPGSINQPPSVTLSVEPE